MKLGVRQRWLAVGIMFLAAGGLFTLALMPSDGSATESSEPSSEPTTGPFRFVVVGDYGEGGGAEAKIAGAIDQWTDRNPINAFVSTGDNVYPSGAPSQFMGAWNAPYAWVSQEKTPVIATLGNHDVETDGGPPVMDLLGMSARWYTRRIGPVEFIILDANDPTNADQLQFLKDALMEAGSKIALGRALKDLSGSLSKEVKRCPWAPVPPGPMLFATRRLPLLPVTARAMSSSPARGDRLRG